MQSAISVTISHQNEVIYSNAKTAQSMKDEGYQQPSLQTDIEPLPKLKEGELLYLGAAIEKMKEEVGQFLSSRIAKKEEEEKMSKEPKEKKQRVCGRE
ncbi:hypothetical protein AV274_0696 [Blastocystis sp. ATCC 50177/Nand II]|uniref:Uncharacterized protein n=1 Tax=Blastocystis sp. subtype 1 (strain ATCC 50177 / NandII) TaxID=478820 RepID=A0A196SMX6_BLAHN|nr:hypothetical protein AV274_0696 [Blastocystis sp. ATCC 50177/Nand II]